LGRTDHERPTRATEPPLMHCHRQRQAIGEESAESAARTLLAHC
jgi:hypothetical protein